MCGWRSDRSDRSVERANRTEVTESDSGVLCFIFRHNTMDPEVKHGHDIFWKRTEKENKEVSYEFEMTITEYFSFDLHHVELRLEFHSLAHSTVLVAFCRNSIVIGSRIYSKEKNFFLLLFHRYSPDTRDSGMCKNGERKHDLGAMRPLGSSFGSEFWIFLPIVRVAAQIWNHYC